MAKIIQVIGRAFDILEHLGPHREVSLEALTAATRLNKGTLCNILKTLMLLGYVEKSGHGNYRLSSKFLELGEASSIEKLIAETSEHYSRQLAEDTMESGVICTLRMAKVHILAQSQFQRSLMINPFSVYGDISLYHSVSGRVLIAFLSEDERSKLVGTAGFPGAGWNNIQNMDKLEKNCAGIRSEGISIMTNAEKEIKAFAVPVRNSEGQICASLGLTMPVCRLDNAVEKKVLASLKDNSMKLEKAFLREKFSRDDFIKI